MKFFSYFSVTELSNTYLIGSDDGGDAIIIDPGVFDEGLLKLIEDYRFYVRYVLITHAHHPHVSGLKTILKIYEVSIFCYDPGILDPPAHHIKGGNRLKLGEFSIEVIETPGHSNDSLSYKIGRLLFTGDALTAGSIGKTTGYFEGALLLSSIRKKLFDLDDNTLIFPGHGPPTTIGIEKKLNPYLK